MVGQFATPVQPCTGDHISLTFSERRSHPGVSCAGQSQRAAGALEGEMDRRHFFGAIAGSAIIGATAAHLAGNARVDSAENAGHLVGHHRPKRITATSITWQAATDEQVVALTFDDGPDPRYTPDILKILERHDAPATFFMQGLHVENYPGLARTVADAGHDIGNHTFYHRNLSTASADKTRDELERTHHAIRRITGVDVSLFRPPWGHLSGAASMIAAAMGYRIVIWSDHLDSKATGRSNVRKIGRHAKPGSIVLAHDGGTLPNGTVVDALPGIISKLRDRGFRLATVSELLEQPAITEPEPATDLVNHSDPDQ